MLEEQIIPRLLARSGQQTVIRLKRFHSYGLGESHVDSLLSGLEVLVLDGSLKLGFRAHYPQLETKLTMRGKDQAEVATKLAPIIAEVQRRIGNFIVAEDDATLEGVVLEHLRQTQSTLALVETFTGGQIAARLAPLPGAETVFRRGIVARDLTELCRAVAVNGTIPASPISTETAVAIATAARQQSSATHALAVLVDLEDGADSMALGGTICLAVVTANEAVWRQSRLTGGRDWVRLGAVEMGLDSLRRYMQGLPVQERIDFERQG
jgi:nicotinamide-nucleotide amidase